MLEDFKEEYIIGAPLDFNKITGITNSHQNISFNQMASSIPFEDITIFPFKINDKFEVKLTLNDESGIPIPAAKITMGETDDGKYRSN